jgi:hypothetical protein
VSRIGQRRDQRGRRRVVDIDKTDPRALSRKMLDQRRADPAGAAGDQHAAISEAGIAGKT